LSEIRQISSPRLSGAFLIVDSNVVVVILVKLFLFEVKNKCACVRHCALTHGSSTWMAV
jgi:hypothetical protein